MLIHRFFPISRASSLRSSLIKKSPLSLLISTRATTTLRRFSQQRTLYKQHDQEEEEQQQPRQTQFQQRIDTVKEKSQKVSNQVRANIKYAIDPQRENIYTIPNILTFTRLIAAPVIGVLIVQQQVWWAFAMFTYSAITDFVDGFIARRFNMKSVVGSIIDPMADKFLMVICTGCLAQAGGIPLYLAVIILGRDILLGISALYYRYISLPPPKTLLRFWDFSIPSVKVYPTLISKYNTGFQMLYIMGAVLKPVLLQVLDPSMINTVDVGFEWFGYLVATTTLISGLSYVFSKNAVKILTPPTKKNKNN